MNKLVLFSDIHSSARIFERLNPTDNNYFLGDMFDRGTQSHLVLDEFIKLLDQDAITIILGNHDELVYNVIFGLEKQELELYDLYLWALNDGYQTFRQLFTVQAQVFMPLFERAKKIKFAHNLETLDFINEWYKAFETVMLDEENNLTVEKLRRLSQASIQHQVVDFLETKILLSHTGIKDDTWSRYGMIAGTNHYNDIDFSVMGHWNYAEFAAVDGYELIKTPEDSLLFNRRSHVLMIDNGSCNNLVIINQEVIDKLKQASILMWTHNSHYNKKRTK